MRHQRVDLSKLVSSDQPRPLITADVDRLAASIGELGLIQPITIKVRSIMNGGLASQGFQIVAGHHRVAACRALGWTEVDAIVIEVGEHLQAELIEIDENLCRSELTAAQRSKAVKRRREIWEALHPAEVSKLKALHRESAKSRGKELEVAQLAPPQVASHGGARPQSKEFAAETAAITGESKSQVNRHLARAEALGDDLDRVAGTSLDKGVELDALKAMSSEQRAPLIERAQAGEKVSARAEAYSQPDHTTVSLIKALEGALKGLLDATGCATSDDLVTLICDTFGTEHKHDIALYQVLREFSNLGGLGLQEKD